jgi:formylglycine-generating enzyme required for sulfatase activity
VYRSGGFWLGTYPVTQGEWQAVTGENSSWFRAGGDGADSVEGLDTSRFPVECVGWDECQEFLKRLNVLGGREAVFGHVDELSLPHEDAWEFACRGGLGNESAYYWGNELNGTQANCDGNYPYGTDEKGAYLARPSVVGAYAVVSPHPWGLCDLHGNVCEWCENLYEQASSRVLRGGSWNVNALYCRAASRYRNAPDNRDDFVGFRVFAPGLY